MRAVGHARHVRHMRKNEAHEAVRHVRDVRQMRHTRHTRQWGMWGMWGKWGSEACEACEGCEANKAKSYPRWIFFGLSIQDSVRERYMMVDVFFFPIFGPVTRDHDTIALLLHVFIFRIFRRTIHRGLYASNVYEMFLNFNEIFLILKL